MRWLEVRRHSLTKKDSTRGRGSHLSAEGVVLARLVGDSLGPFAVVVTSASPRAIETAVAMGLAVDDTVELPSGYVPGEVDHHGQWRWPHPYRSYAELIGRGGGLATVAETHRRIWTTVVAAVPEGAAALVVGHGGGIEPGLVACLPDADHGSSGMPFGHCDGARLAFDGGRFVSVQFRRRPSEQLPGGAKAGGR
jgi:broad specificity phosphatase PhoE